MLPSEYQKLAARTECDQGAAQRRLTDDLAAVRLNHAVQGLSGEVGELSSLVEHHVYYGQPLDVQGVFEELGDVLWYVAEACNALGLDLEKVMEANIEKLKVRYPEKYTDLKAKEQSRDRDSELAAMRHYVQGFRERGLHPRLDNPLANPAGLSPSDTPQVKGN